MMIDAHATDVSKVVHEKVKRINRYVKNNLYTNLLACAKVMDPDSIITGDEMRLSASLKGILKACSHWMRMTIDRVTDRPLSRHSIRELSSCFKRIVINEIKPRLASKDTSTFKYRSI